MMQTSNVPLNGSPQVLNNNFMTGAGKVTEMQANPPQGFTSTNQVAGNT